VSGGGGDRLRVARLHTLHASGGTGEVVAFSVYPVCIHASGWLVGERLVECGRFRE
jgi:hypothetical protein